jgi:Mlc titration factor MtfA (ptsG expression regulator)
MRAWLRERRRSRIRQRPFAQEWEAFLEQNVPLYQRLSDADRHELKGHIRVFLAEKRFEGGGGLSITDEIRVTIAAHACVLLLHRTTDYYPGLYTIIVYPGAYVAERAVWEPMGIVTERAETRLGESSTRGAVVLSWNAVEAAASDVGDCRNVVLHEFAHQLDAEDGSVEGAPAFADRTRYVAWARILGREFARLRRDTALGRQTVLDRYGATSPAEFFAVTTECFFTRPELLNARHPELYAELRDYYQQDPVEPRRSRSLE